MRRDVFQAIADPNRRAILGLIALQSLTLNAIAEKFEISRPAVSKHVKVLEECGLVEITQTGRERFCEAKLQPLKEVNDWVMQYQQFWNTQLDSLDNYLQTIQQTNQHE